MCIRIYYYNIFILNIIRIFIKKKTIIILSELNYFYFSVGITSEQVTAFLKANPEYLEHHIMEEVELEQLERWMIRRTQRARKQTMPIGKNGRKTSLSR